MVRASHRGNGYRIISRILLTLFCSFMGAGAPLVPLCAASAVPTSHGVSESSLLNESKGTIMNSGGSWISKAFFILLAIQLIPGAVKVFSTYYDAITVPKTKVGLVTIAGEIREGSRTVWEIQELLKHKDIKALVLKIESPGGAPGASQAIYSAVKSLSQKHGKPVIAWIENIGASGGYYVAAAANYIICTPSALVGSIGVYIARPYLKDFIEQFKARYIIEHAGKYKAAGNPFKELTPDDATMFDAMLKELHERFIADILEVRPQLKGVSRELWAEGQPLNGDKAVLAIAKLILAKSIAPMGHIALGSFGIIHDIEMFIFVPAIAFAQVVTFLVSNEIGRGDIEGVKYTIKKVLFLATVSVACILCLCVWHAPSIINWFDVHHHFSSLAIPAFRVISLLVLCDVTQVILAGALRGIAQVRTVLQIRTLTLLFFCIPVAYIASHIVFYRDFVKFITIYSSFYIGNGIMAIWYIYLLRVDRWKQLPW